MLIAINSIYLLHALSGRGQVEDRQKERRRERDGAGEREGGERKAGYLNGQSIFYVNITNVLT